MSSPVEASTLPLTDSHTLPVRRERPTATAPVVPSSYDTRSQPSSTNCWMASRLGSTKNETRRCTPTANRRPSQLGMSSARVAARAMAGRPDRIVAAAMAVSANNEVAPWSSSVGIAHSPPTQAPAIAANVLVAYSAPASRSRSSPRARTAAAKTQPDAAGAPPMSTAASTTGSWPQAKVPSRARAPMASRPAGSAERGSDGQLRPRAAPAATVARKVASTMAKVWTVAPSATAARRIHTSSRPREAKPAAPAAACRLQRRWVLRVWGAIGGEVVLQAIAATASPPAAAVSSAPRTPSSGIKTSPAPSTPATAPAVLAVYRVLASRGLIPRATTAQVAPSADAGGSKRITARGHRARGQLWVIVVAAANISGNASAHAAAQVSRTA